MNRVVILLLLITNLSISGCAAQSTSAPTDNAVMGTPAPQVVYVLIAAKDVRRGSRIQESDVSIMGWPITDEIAPPLGALLAESAEDEEALDQVVGRIARVDIIKNQPILDFYLTPTD